MTKPRLTPQVVDAALQLHAVVAEVALSAAECVCHQVLTVGFGERLLPQQEAVVKRPPPRRITHRRHERFASRGTLVRLAVTKSLASTAEMPKSFRYLTQRRVHFTDGGRRVRVHHLRIAYTGVSGALIPDASGCAR